MEEVVGSIPTRSTKPIDKLISHSRAAPVGSERARFFRAFCSPCTSACPEAHERGVFFLAENPRLQFISDVPVSLLPVPDVCVESISGFIADEG